MKKYIVTGGAGFIGSHVVDLLTQAGHDVMVLDDFSTGKVENLENLKGDKRVHILKCDITCEAEVMGAMMTFKPDVILHLAAQAAITTALNDPVRDLIVNGAGTLILTRLAEKFGVSRFVYASTSAVYGEKRMLSMDEDTPLWPRTEYGISKLTGEHYVRIMDVESVILRFGNVYGPRQVPIGENQVIARMMRHLIQGETFEIFGDGKQRRDFIYVEDVARAVIRAATEKMSAMTGYYNIASGKSVSVNEVAVKVAKAYGLPVYEWEYYKKRMDERRNMVMKIERAKYGLRWSPQVILEDGIKRTVEWWKK